MTANSIMRDERTVTVENASYRLAYLLISYGLLGSIMYRAFVTDESTWDLMGLVIVSGVIASAHQARQRVLSRRWMMLTGASVVIAVLIALAIVVTRR